MGAYPKKSKKKANYYKGVKRWKRDLKPDPYQPRREVKVRTWDELTNEERQRYGLYVDPDQ